MRRRWCIDFRSELGTGLSLAIVALGVSAVAAWARDPGEPLPSDVDYRHVHREVAERLFDGHSEQAEAWCEAFVKANPNDAEGHYFHAGALANQGEMEEAVRAAKEALGAGLPPERFWAGPRNVFKPLVQSTVFQESLESIAEAPALLHGPMLGDVRPEGIRIWVRTRKASRVAATAVSEDGTSVVRSNQVATDAESDFTGVARLDNLEADTRYLYWISVDGKPVSEAPAGSFKTSPHDSEEEILRVAFGGGAAYTPRNEKVWSVIGAQRPDLLLMLGDNVYIDAPKNRRYQRYKYYRRHSSPQFRSLVAETPVYSIWDDHDFGRNDGAGGPQVNKPKWKRDVWEVFKENWVNPAYGGGSNHPGCWFEFSVGAVDFFMLDCRYYRTDPNRTPASERSMLGPTQRNWLFKQLKESNARFKVLVSSVPFAKGTKPGSLDTWDGFNQEREAIFSFVEKNEIDGLLLLTADRHRHDIWRIDRQDSIPFYEFESSRITNVHQHRTMEDALFSYNGRGFGMVTFDMTKADPQVHYEIVNERNEVVHEFRLRWSEMQR